MALIAQKDQQALRELLAQRLQGEVTITYYTEHESPLVVPSLECEYCAQTRALLEELTALSDKLHLEVRDFVRDQQEAEGRGIARIFAFELTGRARGRVRFFGIPAGYEFASLLEALIDVSTGSTDLSAATRAALAGLDHDLHLQVFVTPTCPYCPRAVRLAHKLAVESAHVLADAIEATEFPELAQRYGVYGVPKTVIDEMRSFEGALPEAFFMHNVLGEPAAAGREAAPVAHG